VHNDFSILCCYKSQFFLARPALYLSFALLRRTSVGVLLGVHDALRALRAREVPAYALLVFLKSPFNIGRHARVERTVVALEQIDEVQHLVFLHVSPEEKRTDDYPECDA